MRRLNIGNKPNLNHQRLKFHYFYLKWSETEFCSIAKYESNSG